MKTIIITWIAFVCSSCDCFASPEIRAQASYSFRGDDRRGVELVVHLVLTNHSDKEVRIPTSNLGPVSHTEYPFGRITLTFSHFAPRLRNGKYVIAPEASFLAVRLAPAESTLITYKMSATDEDKKLDEVLIRYIIGGDLAARHGYQTCDITVRAETRSVF